MTARLNQIDTIIQSYFEEMQLKWSLLIPQWKLDKEATRQRIENDGNIRQIFVIDAQKFRRFPPMDNEITAAEKTFVDRLETVWRDPQVLFSNQITTASVEQVAMQTNQRATPEVAADSAGLEIQAEANLCQRKCTCSNFQVFKKKSCSSKFKQTRLVYVVLGQ